MPTPLGAGTNTGDIAYWNGTNWVVIGTNLTWDSANLKLILGDTAFLAFSDVSLRRPGASTIGLYQAANQAAWDGNQFYPNPGGTANLGSGGFPWNKAFVSAVEISQTGALTIGSVGSLIAPYDTAAGETDAKGGNLNGAMVVNNADLKIYARTGGAWKGVAIAGFSIPNYAWKNISKNPKKKHLVRATGKDETICPLCKKQMKPKQALGMYADKFYNKRNSKEGLHAVAAHLKCLMVLE